MINFTLKEVAMRTSILFLYFLELLGSPFPPIDKNLNFGTSTNEHFLEFGLYNSLNSFLKSVFPIISPKII
jgi:hypothetical protein